jgi:hypothetical protein
VQRLLKDGFRFVDLEFCLEIVDVVRHGEAVGTAAGVDKGEVLVGNVVAIAAPIVGYSVRIRLFDAIAWPE